VRRRGRGELRRGVGDPGGRVVAEEEGLVGIQVTRAGAGDGSAQRELGEQPTMLNLQGVTIEIPDLNYTLDACQLA
jgi:hypothetical protein